MRSFSTAYQSYLLRLWCEADGGEWRASLEDVELENAIIFPPCHLYLLSYTAGQENQILI